MKKTLQSIFARLLILSLILNFKSLIPMDNNSKDLDINKIQINNKEILEKYINLKQKYYSEKSLPRSKSSIALEIVNSLNRKRESFSAEANSKKFHGLDSLIIFLENQLPEDNLDQWELNAYLDSLQIKEMSEFLIAIGRDDEKEDPKEKFNKQLLEVLIKNGANVNYDDIVTGKSSYELENGKIHKEGRPTSTLLHHAAYLNNASWIELLIKLGIKIDSVDSENRTALMIATKAERLAAVKKLIELGCSVDFKNNNKESALNIALEKNYIEIAYEINLALEKNQKKYSKKKNRKRKYEQN